MVFYLHEFAIGRRLREPEHGTMINPRMAGKYPVGFARFEQDCWQCLHSFRLELSRTSAFALPAVRSYLAILIA
jgi:hypothetical protein